MEEWGRVSRGEASGGGVRDWSGRAGQERDTGGMNWEFRRKRDPFLGKANERRLTGKSPGQAPLFVPLEEAELLRRVRHEKIFRLLVVVQHHAVGLAADARLLVAAEGRVGRVRVVAVGPDAARLDGAARAVGGVRVAGPDSRRRGRTGCRWPC